MKHILTLMFLTALICSCSNEIQDNTPAFQGVVDSTLFRSADSRAVFNDNGSLVIQGNSGAQTLSILISSLDQTPVQLGGDNPTTNIASYTDEFGNIFSTASSNASGMVDYQVNTDNTLSGTFNFMALRNGIQDTITLSRGFMFEIPVLSDLGNIPNTGTGDTFTARVNSLIFNPTLILPADSGNVLSITGQSQQASIVLIFPTDIAPGTYDITLTGDIRASYLVTVDNEIFNAESGTLTIVANDTGANEVEGNFIFEVDGFTITDGEFSVSY